MKRPAKLSEVRNEDRIAEAKRVRKQLFTNCRAACEQHGDDIAGFALVVWDSRGSLRSAYDANNGPVSFALVPTLVADALNRHVAVMLTKDQLQAEAE